jgi:DNA-binding transcriptional MerR regulator
MIASGKKRYQALKFARLAGVTVRALHHYDRLGLLKPASRSGGGYRLYSTDDFARLQQIVTLKFIGFTLREIKKLMAGADLATALRLQRASLEQKRRHLSLAITAITQAEQLPPSRRGANWEAFATIIKRIQMQTNSEWTKQYYNEEAQKVLAERGKLWSPEMQEKISKDWMKLLADVRAAHTGGVNPESAEGQALAGRWDGLMEGFTGGNAAVQEGLKKVWANAGQMPAEMKQNTQPFRDAMNPEICGFIAKARAARAKS